MKPPTYLVLIKFAGSLAAYPSNTIQQAMKDLQKAEDIRQEGGRFIQAHVMKWSARYRAYLVPE